MKSHVYGFPLPHAITLWFQVCSYTGWVIMIMQLIIHLYHDVSSHHKAKALNSQCCADGGNQLVCHKFQLKRLLAIFSKTKTGGDIFPLGLPSAMPPRHQLNSSHSRTLEHFIMYIWFVHWEVLWPCNYWIHWQCFPLPTKPRPAVNFGI